MSRNTVKRPARAFEAIDLKAHVLKEVPPPFITQRTLCEWLDKSPQTIREWHHRGLPFVKTDGGIRYPAPDCVAWDIYFQHLIRVGRAPRLVSLAKAREWALTQNFEQDPDQFVIVPLDWDHPRRAEQLKLAALGIEPRDEDEWGNPDA